jgi:hypothetical protein
VKTRVGKGEGRREEIGDARGRRHSLWALSQTDPSLSPPSHTLSSLPSMAPCGLSRRVSRREHGSTHTRLDAAAICPVSPSGPWGGKQHFLQFFVVRRQCGAAVRGGATRGGRRGRRACFQPSRRPPLPKRGGEANHTKTQPHILISLTYQSNRHRWIRALSPKPSSNRQATSPPRLPLPPPPPPAFAPPRRHA